MQKLTSFATILLFSVLLFGQNAKDTSNYPYWIDMMQDETVSFYKTQEAFETYWKGRTRSKGDGYNAFKRWEWFMESEVLANGDYRTIDAIQAEVMKFRSNYTTQMAPSSHSGPGQKGQWENLGPINKPRASSGQPNGMGRINAIGVHPTNDNIVFVGAPNGGIWRTYDKGKTWASNTDTNFSMQISSIVFNTKNAQIVYVGTGDRDAGSRTQRGVMKSTNGGIQWSRSNTGMGNRVVGKLIINPKQPDTLIAATNGGIYRSLNAGASWTRTSATGNYKDVVAMPGNFQIMYATASGKYYRSANGGASWTALYIPKSGNRIAIGVTPADPSYVYLVQTTQRAFAGLMLSKDSGKTFALKSTTPNIMDWSTNGSGTSGQAWYDLDISVNPKNKAQVFVGGVNIFRSNNEGVTWRINAHWTGQGGAPAVHADHHVMEWSADGKTLYDGGDGGVSYTTNTGSSWTNIGSGLAISEVYKIGQHAYNENRVICGYQDNGSAIYRGKGNWTTEIGGDGMECVFDPENLTYVYGELYYGSIRRSRNGGSTFGSITGGISEQGAWVSPYILNEGDAKILYVGMTSYIWRSLNVRANSVQWKNISPSVSTSGKAWSVLESSPANSNVLYAVRSGKRMFRTDNANANTPTWTDLTTRLPNGNAPSDIEAHPWNQNIVYITSGAKVHMSTNKGLNWTDISKNLPGTAKRTLVFDKFSRGGIYVGGTPNVYYIDSSMTNWIEYSNGLPGDVSVTELELFYDTLNPTNSKLRAGTYGRGLWSVDLSDINNRSPHAKIIGGAGFFCTNNTIKLFGDSSENADVYSWVVSPSSGFTYVSGTTPKSKNIELRFQKAGVYSLQLIVSNYYGNDTITRRNNMIAGDSKSGFCTTSTSSTSRNGSGIFNVNLAEIDFYSTGYNGSVSNINNSCTDAAFLYYDSLVSLSVTTGSSVAEYVKAYIDYNNDGDFLDAGENVASIGSGTGKRTVNFRTVKAPFSNNALRMRVVSDINQISSACGTLARGESQDYSVWFDAPEADIQFSDTIVCPNQTVSIKSIWVGKVDSLSWDFGKWATPQYAQGNGPHNVKYSNSGIWKVRVQLNSSVWFEDSIQVMNSPIAALELDSSKSDFCEGGNARLVVKKPNGLAGFYSWYKNGTRINGHLDSVFVQTKLSRLNSYSFQVLTGNGACFDTSEIIKIIPFDRPTAWIGIVKTTQCEIGNNFLFKDISLFNGSGISRTWNFGDGNTDTSKDVNHTYSKSGIYNVNLISLSDKGCADTTSQEVTVNSSPDSNFTISNPQAADFLFLPADTALTTYKWDFGDGSNSTFKKPVHTYTSTGSFIVKLEVTNSNSCSGTSTNSLEADTKISTEEFTRKFGLQIFPNPAHGKVKLKLNTSGPLKLSVVDGLGRSVLSKTTEVVSGLEEVINLDKTGFYFITLQIGGLSATYQIENL